MLFRKKAKIDKNSCVKSDTIAKKKLSEELSQSVLSSIDSLISEIKASHGKSENHFNK